MSGMAGGSARRRAMHLRIDGGFAQFHERCGGNDRSSARMAPYQARG